jgi:hypothetical protein
MQSWSIHISFQALLAERRRCRLGASGKGAAVHGEARRVGGRGAVDGGRWAVVSCALSSVFYPELLRCWGYCAGEQRGRQVQVQVRRMDAGAVGT